MSEGFVFDQGAWETLQSLPAEDRMAHFLALSGLDLDEAPDPSLAGLSADEIKRRLFAQVRRDLQQMDAAMAQLSLSRAS